jgi:hypothetical protein
VSDVRRAAAALAGLWIVVVAQPLLDALGRAPEFFVAHRADALDILAVAAVLTMAGPVAFGVALLLVSRAGKRAIEYVAAVLAGVLLAVLATQVGYRAGLDGWAAVVLVAAVATVVTIVAWHRWAIVRTFMLVLSPLGVVVPVLFLWNTIGVGGLESARSTATARATPLVIVVFDELSLVSLMSADGRINAARYPNFAALAADGVWFRNATAVSDYTRWALPAILTGRYPVAGSTPTPQAHPDTLFSLVSRSHRFEVFEQVTALCPRQLCAPRETDRSTRWAAVTRDLGVVAAHTFLPPEARAGLPALTDNWAGFSADEDAEPESAAENDSGTRVVRARRNWRSIWRQSSGSDNLAAAQSFIDGISRDDPQPSIYFMHTLATHRPLRWLPSGQRIASSRAFDGQSNGGLVNEAWIAAQHRHGGLLQAGLADGLVGRLRARLEHAGLYDDALIVVTADHGIAYQPNAHLRNFSEHTAAEIAPVPLIVKMPAGVAGVTPGTIDDRNAETIDILPTVARVLGVDPPGAVDGGSLIGHDPPRPQKYFFHVNASVRSPLDAATLSRRRDGLVRVQSELYGEEAWPIYSLPEVRSYIGRDVSGIEVRDAEAIHVTLERRGLFDEVDLAARELPAQVVGRFAQSNADAAERFRVLVSINGRIVASTRAYPGSTRWIAMVPPDALQAGKNRVDVLLVEPAQPAHVVRPRQ